MIYHRNTKIILILYVLTIFDVYYIFFFFYDDRYILYICVIDKLNTLCILLKVHIILIEIKTKNKP